MATAVKGLDDANDKVTNICASGCALSLSFSLIAMVAGAAAVFLQRKYARASETDDLATRASKPTTDKKSGGCCVGDPKNHGSGAVPKGSCKGRAAQVISIFGLISAVIVLIINIAYGMLFWASVLINVGVPGLGYGIWIQIITLILAIIAYSMGLCCCTVERGWNCTSVFLLVLSFLYVVAIALIAISRDRLDAMIDKECEEDDDPYSSGDNDDCGSGLHVIFGFLYGCIIPNLIFAAVAAFFLRAAAPDWVDRVAGEASKVPAGERQGAVKSIHMRTGDLVDQVQFEYRSGKFSTWGRDGGGKKPSFHLHDDEYLESIEYHQDGYLHAICFCTNKGRKSQWYGNRRRSFSTLHAAAGQMIVGLKRGGGFCAKIKGIEEEPVATVFDRLVGVSQDWLHDGKNRNGEFILLGNGTCIGCGSRGASNKWKVSGDRTITATFHGVTHFIEYSPDLRSATIVNPKRSPLTRIRAEPMPVVAAAEAPAGPLAEEEA